MYANIFSVCFYIVCFLISFWFLFRIFKELFKHD